MTKRPYIDTKTELIDGYDDSFDFSVFIDGGRDGFKPLLSGELTQSLGRRPYRLKIYGLKNADYSSLSDAITALNKFCNSYLKNLLTKPIKLQIPKGFYDRSK